MSCYEDRIYHDGYLDGYYASMELYHSDDSEMTEEEKARRKKRRRAVALGAGAAATLGVGGYAIGRALRKRKKVRPKSIKPSGPKLQRIKNDPWEETTPNGWDFKRNKPTYAFWNQKDDDEYDHERYLRAAYNVWDHDKKKVVELPWSEANYDKRTWNARKRREQ